MNERKFEYIDREKAIKELTDWKWGLDETCVMQAIGCVPAEDVAPVVRGNWRYFKKRNKAVCTNCSFERELDENFGAAVACPNCGARMDGDSDA